MENNYDPNSEILFRKPVIKVIGLGGGGGNAVNRMISKGFPGVKFIAANTDYQALQSNNAHVKVLLGPNSSVGRGAGGDPSVGERAARESVDELRAALQGADIVFLTAGMGGGTGSGAISVAAEIARAQGAITISIVNTPFSFEAGKRIANANRCLNKLAQVSDTMITIPNDQLLKVCPKNMTLKQTFELADDVLRQGVQGMTELLNGVGVMNVDFAHIRSMLLNGGGSILSIGKGKGSDRVTQAMQQALNHPLLDRIPIENATGIIANFTGPESLGFGEVVDGMTYLQGLTNNQADLIPGQTIDSTLAEDEVELILILTGIASTPINATFDIATEMVDMHEAKEPVETVTRKSKTVSIRRRNVTIDSKPQSEDVPVFSYQSTKPVAQSESAGPLNISPKAAAAFDSYFSPLDPTKGAKPAEANPLSDPIVNNRPDLDVPTFIRRRM